MSSLGIFDKETKTYKKVADLSKPAVIDSSMSDTSTNAVQNKVVKSYVDGRTTLDTSMSDTSTNPVQNKVVKSYVDGRTTLDTAMSDTSTNAVQNKVVKNYIDWRTTLDTSMSDSSTNAVQNKIVKSYVDGTFKRKLIGVIPGDGISPYCRLCTIKINNSWADTPIEITVQERQRETLDRLTVLFHSADNNDPGLRSFKVFGEVCDWYISKRDASTWVIYGTKYELWSEIYVVDYVGINNANVTWDLAPVTALPDSKTKAVWAGIVNHAVSADSAISASTVNGHTVNSDVPSNAVFTDTNTWRGIQNNLTSDSTIDSLSAAQGKVLKGLVDEKAASDHTHNYDSTYLKYTTVKVSPSSTAVIWHSGEPDSYKKLILFTARIYGHSYMHDIVWFYNGKLYTPDFSSKVGIDTTLNNFTYTNNFGVCYVKYNNIETISECTATVKCYDFIG